MALLSTGITSTFVFFKTLTRKLLLKKEGKGANNDHLSCTMVILFLIRHSYRSADISEVVRNTNKDLKQRSTINQPT
jgi:hypothetical protein